MEIDPKMSTEEVMEVDEITTDCSADLKATAVESELSKGDAKEQPKAKAEAAEEATAAVDVKPPSQLRPNEDDSNVDELAGYFDELLHIPKELSLMASSMYS